MQLVGGHLLSNYFMIDWPGLYHTHTNLCLSPDGHEWECTRNISVGTIYMCVYIYIYTNTHTHTHTHMYVCVVSMRGK